MEDCLVYFFTGFLDSGKTSFIQSWIGDGSFQDKKVLILLTEEGEVELPPEEKAPCKSLNIITAETDEVTRAFTYNLDAKYHPDVVLIGARMMHFLMPFYILYIPVEVMFSALRGMGNSVIPTVITFFGVCVLRSAWGLFIVPFHHTVNMVLLGFPVTWVVTDLAFAVYFSRYLKKHREAA